MTGTTVLEFDVPDKRSGTVPSIQFRLRSPTGSAEDYVMRMPKLASTAGIVAMIQDDDLDVRKHGARLAQAMIGLIDFVEPQPPQPDRLDNPDWREGMDEELRTVPNPKAGQFRGRARIHQRLLDPDDALDVEHLAVVFKACVGDLFKRPTGPSPESSPQQANGGPDSAGASLDKPAATSTT